jgi:hypothetical protein
MKPTKGKSVKAFPNLEEVATPRDILITNGEDHLIEEIVNDNYVYITFNSDYCICE